MGHFGRAQLASAVALLSAASSAQAQLKVACAGEHSTQSAFVADDQEYPARLQRFLGDAGWTIGNFGYRRATVQTTGPSLYPQSTPYLQTVEFQNSVAFAPDIVVVGPFGMHDCNMVYTDAGSIDYSGYLTGLRNIVDAYEALPKKPRILMALPIPYAWGNADAVMSQVVLPITEQVACEHGLQLVDHWNPYLDRPDLFSTAFPAGDHFEDAGMDQMAFSVMASLLYDGGFNPCVFDAGMPDAGPPDAGPIDAGAAADAGAPPDAGSGAPDAGTLPATDGMLHPAANGCSAAPGALLLFALGAVLFRARRRSA